MASTHLIVGLIKLWTIEFLTILGNMVCEVNDLVKCHQYTAICQKGKEANL
jgi:hypothetical protein